MTALALITDAMVKLGTLEPGGVPNADQQTAFLSMLNTMLESWQMMRLAGSTRTQIVNASGEMVTTTTPTAVATFGAIGANNAYPKGWDDAITWQLAQQIASSLGMAVPEFMVAKAAAALAAISPVPPAPDSKG